MQIVQPRVFEDLLKSRDLSDLSAVTLLAQLTFEKSLLKVCLIDNLCARLQLPVNQHRGNTKKHEECADSNSDRRFHGNLAAGAEVLKSPPHPN